MVALFRVTHSCLLGFPWGVLAEGSQALGSGSCVCCWVLASWAEFWPPGLEDADDRGVQAVRGRLIAVRIGYAHLFEGEAREGGLYPFLCEGARRGVQGDGVVVHFLFLARLNH